jgi:hypothetical protein
MTRDQIIEAMVDAYTASMAHAGDRKLAMFRALTAIEAAGAVIVPREPTPEMLAAAWRAWHARHGGKLGPGPAFAEALSAMIEASPFKETTNAG